MKPHVICHMLGPLDGRLLVESWAPEGTPANKTFIDEYERIHGEFEADAWLAGTTTMKEFATGSPSQQPATSQTPVRPWHLADKNATHFAIGLDRKGQLHWDTPIADQGHVVVVLGKSVPDSHLSELVAAGVSYLVVPSDEIDLSNLLSELDARLNIKKLLVEGGGTTSGAFVKAGLVDEISLLLCPAIAATSGKPAIFEAGEDGIGAALQLELKSATPVAAGAVHLRYDITKQPA
jgi:riboflavin biosynthesis pyrimidine reductase